MFDRVFEHIYLHEKSNFNVLHMSLFIFNRQDGQQFPEHPTKCPHLIRGVFLISILADGGRCSPIFVLLLQQVRCIPTRCDPSVCKHQHSANIHQTLCCITSCVKFDRVITFSINQIGDIYRLM